MMCACMVHMIQMSRPRSGLGGQSLNMEQEMSFGPVVVESIVFAPLSTTLSLFAYWKCTMTVRSMIAVVVVAAHCTVVVEHDGD